ncbi:MAG: DUF29 domain-containing protein [Methylobacteriaceae bacterium]|nr:DUF29 domain-containing protein [Methylobacteriaceae bacterium]
MDGRSLYEDDIYAWAEEQAAALRRLAADPRAAPPGLDLEHLAEEIADLGKSELRAATSPLVQALAHLAKLAGDPGSLAAAHWAGEVLRFLLDARAAYAPSMRRQIDLDRLWRDAARLAHASLAAYGIEAVPNLPRQAPFTLDELLDEGFDVRAAVARLQRTAEG